MQAFVFSDFSCGQHIPWIEQSASSNWSAPPNSGSGWQHQLNGERGILQKNPKENTK